MKRNIIIVFLFLNSFIYSQNFEIQWQQCFGGSDMDIAKDILEVQGGVLYNWKH
jgi:hypothetical protein